VGHHCPIDGWSGPESKELVAAAQNLLKAGSELSVEALRKIGVREGTLTRTIVVDFGDERSSFDAIVPEGYVVQGEWKKLRDLGEHFVV
jgi:hypothetical protein